jgi:hypothetical protein
MYQLVRAVQQMAPKFQLWVQNHVFHAQAESPTVPAAVSVQMEQLPAQEDALHPLISLAPTSQRVRSVELQFQIAQIVSQEPQHRISCHNARYVLRIPP